MENFKWDLKWFRAKQECPFYLLVHKDFDSLDMLAIGLQTLACFGLALMAWIIYDTKDKKKIVTAHPSMILAQICYL